MKYLTIAIVLCGMFGCTGASDGGYDDTKGGESNDRTDTLNRESPYNVPGAAEGSTPGE